MWVIVPFVLFMSFGLLNIVVGVFVEGAISTAASDAEHKLKLKEESFHLGTGANGLRRIVKAGVIPLNFLQKYINKWVSTGLDLFGTDESTSAEWAYVYGVKGRYDERESEISNHACIP